MKRVTTTLMTMAALALLAGPAGAAIIGVTNTGTGTVVDDGSSSATITDWSLSGGNAVVVYFAGEEANGLSATYGSESMTVVEDISGDRWAGAIAYLINPSASTADVALSWTNNAGGESVHQPISLENVGSVAASQATDSGALSFEYTTTEDGGFVVGAGTDNGWNSTPTNMSASGNIADTEVRNQANSGNFGSLFVYGGVPTAGTYTDSLNNTESAAAIAFEAGAGIPEPASLSLLALSGLALLNRRRRR